MLFGESSVACVRVSTTGTTERPMAGIMTTLKVMLMNVSVYTVQGTAAQSGDPTIDVAKARALGNALVPFLVVPWTCSLIVYSGAFSSGHDNLNTLLIAMFVQIEEDSILTTHATQMQMT